MFLITFLDHNDVEYGAEASISITNGVNGERSISGTIHSGDAVINNIDKGWRLRFEDEYYSVIFAEPIDLGRDKEAKFDAVHQFFYDFDKTNVYGELNGSSTFINYLNFIFNGSGYSYSLEIDVKAIEKENFGYKSRLSLFYDIINSAGVEFVVHGRVVRILARVGTDLSTIVKKGFNLNEIRLEKNIGSFVTFKKGFGAFIDDENPSLGRLEVEYESPLAQIYGRREAEPLVDERWSVEENLYERLKAEVDNSYSISVQIDMEDLTKAGYDYEQPHAGDYIMAINDDLDLKERIRIVSFQSDYDVIGTLISHKVTCNSIGNVKKQTNDYTIIDEKINDAISRTEEKFLGIVSANGRNRNYYGSEFPIDEPKGTLIVGDQLWLKIGEVTKRYYWNGEEWVVDPFSENQEWLNEEIDRIQSQADQLGKNIEASDQKAGQALIDAGLAQSAAESALTYADGVAQSAYDDAVEQAGIIAQNALSSANSYVDSRIIEYDDGMELRIEQVVKGTNIDDLIGWASYKETIDGLDYTVATIQGTAYKQAQTDMTVDQINQSIVSGSDGRIANFNVLTNTVDAMEQMIGTQEKVARAVLTSDLWLTEIESLNQSPNLLSKSAVITGLQTSPTQPDTIYLYDDGWYAVIEIDPTKKYSISGNGARQFGWTVNKPDVLVPLLDKQFYSAAQDFSNLAPPANARYLYIQYGHHANSPLNRMQVEEGSVVTPYRPANADNESVRSAISQQLDSISLGLFNALDMFSGISVVERGVRIVGDLIHLSGNSLIDNAVIKDAMIDNLSASKLTAGVIDAQEINVININGNNITANRASLIQVGIHALNSDMWLDGNGLTIDSHLSWDMSLRNYGLAFDDQYAQRIGLISAFENRVTGVAQGVFLAAARNKIAGLYYQGDNTDASMDYNAGVQVDGTTGDTAIINTLKGNLTHTRGFKISQVTIGSVPVVALIAVDNFGNEIGGVAVGGSNLYYINSFNESGGRVWRNMNNS